MNKLVALGASTLTVLTSANAFALEHYLLARTATSFQGAAVSAPDLTPFVEHTYEVGVGGVDPASVHNHSQVGSDSGHFVVTMQAAQKSGTVTIDPKGWAPATRLEETFHKPAGSTVTSVRASFTTVAGATLTSASPMTFKANATLDVNGCRLYLSRTTTTTTAVPDELIDNCAGNVNAITASRQGDALVIEVKVTGSTVNVQAQLDVVANYGGGFVGSIDANATGDLVVQAIGGTLTPASPTFGSTAAAPDGGASDASVESDSGASADAAVPSGGPASGGTDPIADAGLGASPTPGPSGSSDGGCNLGAARGSAPGAIGIALVAGLALARRRRRG
ncbi:MAG: hypothetical protein U0235_18095 [Polyangiaceae bacterium]